MKKLFALSLLLVSFLSQAKCLPEHTGARIVEMPPGPYYNVVGTFSKFNDCHPTVKLTIVNPNAPVVIVLHGGGGTEEYQLELAKRLNAEGYSTLTYDAFKMNGLHRNAGFWAKQMYTPPKQRMLYHSALDAYRWILDNPKILKKEVYIYGTSSGGSAALNVASVGDPSTLKAVFAEGPAPQGIGFPHVLNVPVYVIYGKEDNYFVANKSERFWTKTEKCNWNAPPVDTPKGTADNCNHDLNPQSLTTPAIEYFNLQKSKGYNINIKFYDNAGHAFFHSDLTPLYYEYAKRHVTFGSTKSARDELVKDVSDVIKRNN
jgi:dienelactone hydrolase